MTVKPPATSPLRALVAEEDPLVRRLLVGALQALDMAAEEAEDGSAVLEAARREMPDLFILGGEMPGLDGLDACTAIREMPGGQDVPVLIVAGRDDFPSIERALEVGATDLIRKPTDTPRLQHRIRVQMRACEASRRICETRAELQASQRRLEKFQDLASVGDWEWNIETDRLALSPQAIVIMGSDSDPPPSHVDFLERCVHPDDRDATLKSLQEARESSGSVRFDHRILDGSRVVQHILEANASIPGEGTIVAGTAQDITEQKRAEERIRELAFYDSLTGLPNRRLLEDRLSRALEWCRHSGVCVGLLFVNLDHFKRVNERLGYLVGDQLLKQVAERLLSSVRFADSLVRAGPVPVAQTSVSRFGGDEFAVVLSGLRDAQDAGQVAQRLRENLRPPFMVDDKQVRISATIGIAIAPSDGTECESLFQKANMAMNHAKERGPDNHQFFNASMNEAATRAMEIDSSLRRALEEKRLVLYYQPLVRVGSGQIVGAEALLRMWGPDGKLLPPASFIPIAEESSRIVSLGAWALRTACGQLARWQAEGWRAARIAVNVSANQLRRTNFPRIVEGVLSQTQVEPSSLELEVTENVFLEEGGAEALHELRRMGISIAIDDFGTGFASFSCLKRMPADVLKIDRSFIQGIGSGEGAIVAAIIAMAHELGCSVVAEGVETDEELEFLRANGCDVLQGSRCGAPVPPEEFRWRSSQG
jgi:diguanylate cyclase (GGDEF)-like protein